MCKEYNHSIVKLDAFEKISQREKITMDGFCRKLHLCFNGGSSKCILERKHGESSHYGCILSRRQSPKKLAKLCSCVRCNFSQCNSCLCHSEKDNSNYQGRLPCHQENTLPNRFTNESISQQNNFSSSC